jgi:hypothetical protein
MQVIQYKQYSGMSTVSPYSYEPAMTGPRSAQTLRTTKGSGFPQFGTSLLNSGADPAIILMARTTLFGQ